MIARMWRCEIAVDRGNDHDTFATERSLHTFQAHHGFRGAAFLGEGSARTVLTLWSTTSDIEALERSVLYRKTVDAIMSTGFILRVEPARPPKCCEQLDGLARERYGSLPRAKRPHDSLKTATSA
jgi:hypothetical protein